MKAVVLTGVERIQLCDAPEPKIQADAEVLVKIEKVGICGSDVHYYKTGRIGSQVVQYPYRVGHECSGVVAAVGAARSRVKVGDKVAIDPAVTCQNCDQCKMGRQNTCRNLKYLGTPGQAEGCLCEYIVMPQESVYPVNERITLEQAALSEPLSIGVYAVKQASMTKASKIGILGSGPIGLSVLLAAKAEAVAEIYMTEKIKERLQAAAKAGANWVGNPNNQDIVKDILDLCPLGLDTVYECAGEQETIDQAVELLRPGGKLSIIGIGRVERISFVIDRIRRKEITIINVRRQSNCVEPAIDLVASGKANVDFMITHRFKPEQCKEAFDMVAGYRDGVIKAMVEF